MIGTAEDDATSQSGNDGSEYHLGVAARELERLDVQARFYAPMTRDALLNAGVRRGMRVVDIGCGTGAVSMIAADIVGPEGHVLGVDTAAEPLHQARDLAARTGTNHLSFVQADLMTWIPDVPFDALTGRLICMHLPDASATIRRLASTLRTEGIVVLQEFSISQSYQCPRTPEFSQGLQWILQAFTAVGLPTDLGLSLDRLLDDAGVPPMMAVAASRIEHGADADAYTLMVEILRTLRPVLIGHSVATEQELGLETLEERLRGSAAEVDARAMAPLLCSAWGRTR